VIRAFRVLQGLLGHKAPLVIRVPQVLLDHKALRGHKAQLAPQVLLDHKALLDLALI